ncbi:hypothetical protein [Natrinema marinum]|uniref:hypothetical protein n=1 Tax=Natrinema marinum TaxID=2961598 RepID=UPI0020C88837|nr:hypothetical protein [Natrinema marinum]
MSLIVEATEDRADRSEEERFESAATVDRRSGEQEGRDRIDVTDLHAAGIEEFVRSNVETDAVSLEHRGGRTYLLLEE